MLFDFFLYVHILLMRMSTTNMYWSFRKSTSYIGLEELYKYSLMILSKNWDMIIFSNNICWMVMDMLHKLNCYCLIKISNSYHLILNVNCNTKLAVNSAPSSFRTVVKSKILILKTCTMLYKHAGETSNITLY